MNLTNEQLAQCQAEFERHIFNTWKTGDGKPFVITANLSAPVEYWYGDDESGFEWRGWLAAWNIRQPEVKLRKECPVCGHLGPHDCTVDPEDDRPEVKALKK